MITSEPLVMRIVLARTPMRSTIPEASSTCTMSPTLIGRSNNKIKPEINLLKIFYKPNPTPTLKAPAMIVTRVISTHRAANAKKNPANKIK